MRRRCWVVCLNGHPMGVCDGSKKDASRLMKRLDKEYMDEWGFIHDSYNDYRMQCHWEVRQVTFWERP